MKLSLQRAHLLIEGNLLHVCAHFGTQVGLLSTNRSRPTLCQIPVEAHTKCTIGVKKTLQAFNVHQKINDVRISEVLLRCKSSCRHTTYVMSTSHLRHAHLDMKTLFDIKDDWTIHENDKDCATNAIC